jgi:hypothetical protein
MGKIRINVIDARRSTNNVIECDIADCILAGLSNEPETIEELQVAAAAYIKLEKEESFFELFLPGVNYESWAQGVIAIDLIARVVAIESSSFMFPVPEGEFFYHDGTKATKTCLPYRISEDWLSLQSIAEFDSRRAQSLEERKSQVHLDARSVLFDRVSEFIVKECLAAREFKKKKPIQMIHAKWLLTPRTDLRGKTPREVLMEKRASIDADIWCREHYWSVMNKPAPCLNENSQAYQFSGFGTNFIVTYYSLVRHMITECWKRIGKGDDVSIPGEIAHLEKAKTEWLDQPNPDDERETPRYVIECERKRLPLASDGSCFHDEDCPCCQAMAKEESGPGFWHFDGSSMEGEYPFDLDVDDYLKMTEHELEAVLVAWEDPQKMMNQHSYE